MLRRVPQNLSPITSSKFCRNRWNGITWTVVSCSSQEVAVSFVTKTDPLPRGHWLGVVLPSGISFSGTFTSNMEPNSRTQNPCPYHGCTVTSESVDCLPWETAPCLVAREISGFTLFLRTFRWLSTVLGRKSKLLTRPHMTWPPPTACKSCPTAPTPQA